MAITHREMMADSSSCVKYAVDNGQPVMHLLGGLPSCIWARALDMLPHEDLLSCSSLNRAFLRDVSPLVSRIMISTNASSRALSYFPSKRFPDVQDVYLYNIMAEIGDHALMARRTCSIENGRLGVPNARDEEENATYKYRLLDDMRSVVPFLTSFKNLQYAFLGGLCTCSAGWNNHYHLDWAHCIRKDLTFTPRRPDGKGRNGVEYMERQSQLIETIALAYHQGRLDSKVQVEGILTESASDVDFKECLWKNSLIQGDDISVEDEEEADEKPQPCKCCRAVCSFFPIEKIFQFHDYQTPCIPLMERVQIAKRRAPGKSIEKILTNALCNILSDGDCNFGLLSYWNREHTTERLEFLVSKGANVKDPSLRKTILEKKKQAIQSGEVLSNSTLAFCVEGPIVKAKLDRNFFRFLTSIGIDITELDFDTVDEEKYARDVVEMLMRNKDKLEEVMKA